jgi:dipeptidyl aminopeptidase/acylaminoacyl peptidase
VAALPAAVSGVLTYQRDGNVYLLPLDSKAERKLTDYPMASPAVFSARSPDGSRLAVVRLDGTGSSLYLMNADGSDERKLLDESAGYTTLERPQWTPDGAAILYTYHGFVVEGGSIKGETFRAERLDPATGERTPLAPDAEGPTLAPDGSLAFVRTTRGGQQLVLLDPSGAERVLVAERTFVSLAAPRFSPDGQRIAVTAVGEGPKLGGAGPAGAEPTAGGGAVGWLRERFGALTGLLAAPIAYAHGEPAHTWVVERSGGVRRVGSLAEDEPTLAWDDSGQYLAVSGGTGVYVLEVASGQPTQLTRVGGFGGIDWTR